MAHSHFIEYSFWYPWIYVDTNFENNLINNFFKLVFYILLSKKDVSFIYLGKNIFVYYLYLDNFVFYYLLFDLDKFTRVIFYLYLDNMYSFI